MFIEEKRHGAKPHFSQRNILQLLHRACKSYPGYYGMHLLVFENTSPDDGEIFLDNNQVSAEHLLRFLRFEVTSP